MKKAAGIYEVDARTKGKRVAGQPWAYRVHAFVPKCVKASGQIAKLFPSTATKAEMMTWQTDTERDALAQARTIQAVDSPLVAAAPGTFEEDSSRYLNQVQHLESFRERKRQILVWCERFKGRSRRTITTAEIRAILNGWRKRWSISTCKALKSTLSNFYDVMENIRDGASSDLNPVSKLTLKWGTDHVAPRAIEFDDARKAINTMPRNLTRARLTVLLETGMRPSQLGRIIPAQHLDLDAAELTVPKGKGNKKGGNVIPLSPEAVAAFKELIRCADPKRGLEKRHVWGKQITNLGKMSRALKAACKRVGVKPISVYCLRHTRAQDLLEQNAGDEAAAYMLNHTDKRMLSKYQRVQARHLRRFVNRGRAA